MVQWRKGQKPSGEQQPNTEPVGRKMPSPRKQWGKTFLRSLRSALIYRGYFRRELQEDCYFLESRGGKEIAGNILRIMLYLQRKKEEALAAEDRSLGTATPAREGRITMVAAVERGHLREVRAFLARCGLREVRLVPRGSVRYYRTLSRAKYLVNDVGFPPSFVKREGQIYLNVWHGTPYKCMGLDNASDRSVMDNIQRNFFMSDMLLYPGEYCRDRMMTAYSLKGLYQGQVVMAGYPRNTVFFDNALREKIRTAYDLEEKRVYVYLPTYREAKDEEERQRQAKCLEDYLLRLDERLKENEVLYVKLHNLVQQEMRGISFSDFQRIRPYPGDVETYEFLSTADCLISDYSSVMFDFALTGRKIIRFLYDEEDYAISRGLYALPTPFPFPRVGTVEMLLSELRCAKGYDDTEFLAAYCRYDNRNATDILMRALGRLEKKGISREAHSGHILLYGGGLEKGEVTDQLFETLAETENAREKAYLCFSRTALQGREEVLDHLPPCAGVIEVDDRLLPTPGEWLAFFLFRKAGLGFGVLNRWRSRLYQREARRAFTGMPFDNFVWFADREDPVVRLFREVMGDRSCWIRKNRRQELRELLDKE